MGAVKGGYLSAAFTPSCPCRLVLASELLAVWVHSMQCSCVRVRSWKRRAWANRSLLRR